MTCISGKTIMPGLFDAHAHGGQGVNQLIPQQNYANYASLALGVTAIHDPSNDTQEIFTASELQKQIEQVLAVLGEIGADSLPLLEVYNKVDLLEGVEPQIQRDANGRPERVWLSARDGRGLPLLKQADSAMVVNVGSTYGSIGYPGYASYCATKFALRGFSEALRRELADTRVSVLYVAPRATRTSMNSAAAQALNVALKANVDDPQAVASAVVHAIAGDRRELYLGWPERFFVFLNHLLPALVDAALRRQLPVIKRHARAKENTHDRFAA